MAASSAWARGLVGLPDGLHFSVGGGVLLLLPAVAAPTDDLTGPVHNDAAHGDLPGGGGLPGQGQGLAHVVFVGHVSASCPFLALL